MLAALVLVVLMCIMHGTLFVLGWLLGANWPYPTNLQISAAWWLILGSVVWVGIQRLLWRRGSPGTRAVLFMAGPVAATWVLFSWCVSLLLYIPGTWKPGSGTGMRWLLDRPVMSTWRAFAGWLLFHLGASGTVNPSEFVDGSSVSHVHQTVIVLGLMNEAMLALLLATVVTVVVLIAGGRLRSGRHAA
jgi:hypothetical protein